jgi:hypothetical protein
MVTLAPKTVNRVHQYHNNLWYYDHGNAAFWDVAGTNEGEVPRIPEVTGRKPKFPLDLAAVSSI